MLFIIQQTQDRDTDWAPESSLFKVGGSNKVERGNVSVEGRTDEMGDGGLLELNIHHEAFGVGGTADVYQRELLDSPRWGCVGVHQCVDLIIRESYHGIRERKRGREIKARRRMGGMREGNESRKEHMR